jgi:hypothetical protein
MKCFLLDDTEPGGKLYLAFGADCVAAAHALIARIGGSADVDRFSVGGSWDVAVDTHIVASAWWPYFTTDPRAHSALDVLRGRRK